MKNSVTTALSKKLSLLLVLLLSLSLLLAACTYDAGSLSSSATPVVAPSPTPTPLVPQAGRNAYAGWAIDAYPDMSQEQMTGAVRRMKEAGANVVWISHANPARSYKDEREIGLNPAVFQAFKDFSLVQHDDAVEIVKAQKRMLQACQEVGLKAVLSVGYHTQMGQEWSKLHPQDLRRDAQGGLWRVAAGSDPYASPYSPSFQKDLRDYYVWIEYEFLSPFRSTIMMLNLADEPLGGDYSGWANAEFKRRTGYNFAQVGNDQARQQALGQFEAGVIPDFVRLAATDWQAITPGLPVTMSFDGGAMREDNGLPDLERLFQEAPPNFVLTWDAYPRDRGTLNIALNEDDVTRLILLVRNIGGYSARYNRKVWFWSAANSWGLGQDVDKPGTIADAQANLLYLPQLMTGVGGQLEGIAVWNYNIRTQGLYNYSWGGVKNTASWNADQMFDRVSSQFEAARSLMTQEVGTPQLVFLKAAEWQYGAIGANRPNYKQTVVDYAHLDLLARNNISSTTFSHWPSQALPPTVKTVVLLSPPEFLTEADLTGLRQWTSSGGSLVGPLGAIQRVTGQTAGQWSDGPTAQPYGQGRVFSSRQPTYELFNTGQAEGLQSFWQNLFGLSQFQSGFMVQTRSSYLYYQLGPTSPAPAWPVNWYNLPVQRFSTNGTAQLFRFNSASWPAWAFERSEFAFSWLPTK